MEKVCIVVPIYKNCLSVYEKVSLTQLFKVLSGYPVYYVAPNSLDISEDYEKALVERFDDRFFESGKIYSELLLSIDFYKRFDRYEYLLIHQLDAFVFSDRLMEFVDMGFDYIGAPLCTHHWREYHIGNGGFSLRNISSALRILGMKEEINSRHHYVERFITGEDNFWAYCGTLDDLDFSVPSIEVANSFSAQSNVFNGLDRISTFGLPFGTHHFPKWNYHFWRAIVCRQGYELPDLSSEDYLDTFARDDKYNRQEQLLKAIEESAERECFDASDFGLSADSKYLLWGAGEWGYLISRVCELCNVPVLKIYDSHPDDSVIVKRNVERPDMLEMKRLVEGGGIILIAAESKQEEIANILNENGFIQGTNYELLTSFKNKWNELLIGQR